MHVHSALGSVAHCNGINKKLNFMFLLYGRGLIQDQLFLHFHIWMHIILICIFVFSSGDVLFFLCSAEIGMNV